MKTINILHQPVTLERLERGLAVAAHLVVQHGAVMAPIFERLEREIATMRAANDTIERAKRLLESNRTTTGTIEAIPLLS
jgi:hypothetical protein